MRPRAFWLFALGLRAGLAAFRVFEKCALLDDDRKTSKAQAGKGSW